ncbi:GTPase-activating and VPS9 domain-containing 1 [Pelobates cultripes]|uniref:GTPase-activating and VPS9 domain-containing 1 n=1 Tax=Pelobates cultripes TaxID=61616 RepID=A0AAD1VZT1_PELCU|nr:GTPase-activating and VPS9 domain-containing 1 [Pelobates cultripes]
MQEDESNLLQALHNLIEFELKESVNPHRYLRKGKCAFSIIFKLFSEGHFSAKVFLTATLYEPIMQLLLEDEDHLERDPSKLTEHFSPAQQEKLFGVKGSNRSK